MGERCEEDSRCDVRLRTVVELKRQATVRWACGEQRSKIRLASMDCKVADGGCESEPCTLKERDTRKLGILRWRGHTTGETSMDKKRGNIWKGRQNGLKVFIGALSFALTYKRANGGAKGKKHLD